MNKNLNELLSGRDNNFDFIRLCAAVAVIFSHSYPLTGHMKDEPLAKLSGDLTTFGTISVAVFFVISGVLIAQSFDRTKEFVHFIEARMLRIYPALIIMVLTTVFVLGPILTTVPLIQYFTDILTVKYLLNLTALHMQFDLPGLFLNNPLPAVNGSLWTLPGEISCYLVTASFFSLLNKRYIRCLLLATFVALVLGKYFISINTLYFAMGTGMYLGRRYIQMNSILAIFSAMGLLFVLMYRMHHLPAQILLGVTTAYLTLYLGFARTGKLKDFSRYGDFSYGLYIWAFPIQQIIVLNVPNISIANLFMLSAFCTLIVSIGSWHLVEKPFLKLKKRLRYDKAFPSLSS